jgi:hypothetical protein
MTDFVDDFFEQAFNAYLSQDSDVKSEGRSISNIVKVYPDMIQVFVYHNDYQLASRKSVMDKLKKETKREDSIHRSVRRSKNTVRDIVQCNSWDYWVTFTFNPKKINRYDFDRCRHLMSLWLDRQKGMRYIIVPEFHKKCSECVELKSQSCSHSDRPKAVHFHALLGNYRGTLVDSGKKTKYGSPIYKGNYRGGFNEFVKIDENTEAIAKYMTKQYITKDMPLVHGRKRYWTSRNLSRPEHYINGLSTLNLWDLLKTHKPNFINEYYESHTIKKDKATIVTPQSQTQLF